MSDQQPWGGQYGQPSGQWTGQGPQGQSDPHGQGAGQWTSQEQFGQPGQFARHSQPAQGGRPLGGAGGLFTPLTVAGASVGLFLLTVLSYFLSWKKSPGTTVPRSTTTVSGFRRPPRTVRPDMPS